MPLSELAGPPPSSFLAPSVLLEARPEMRRGTSSRCTGDWVFLPLADLPDER